MDSLTDNYRTRKEISVIGNNQPNAMRSFKKLDDSIRPFVTHKKPTPVQAQVIPAVLKKRDLIVCSPTGTGKTLAYIIPLMILLENKDMKKPEGDKVPCGSVIIAPNQELAVQICNVAKTLTKDKTIALMMAQRTRTLDKIDILIATPRCFNTHAELFDFSNIEALIVDEVDILFDSKSLLKEFDQIFKHIPKTTQKLFFSATITENAEELSKLSMVSPLVITVGQKNKPVDNINQKIVFAGTEEGKISELKKIIQSGIKMPVLVFVHSTKKTLHLADILSKMEVNAHCIHNGLSKEAKRKCIRLFKDGEIDFLISTDLLARGLDFDNIETVISYDMPESAEVYIHRIGRTGRAKKTGDSIVFFEKTDKKKLPVVAKVMRDSGNYVPEWMDKLIK